MRIALAGRYEACFGILERKMNELCGGAVTECAICAILADMPFENIDRLYKAGKNGLF